MGCQFFNVVSGKCFKHEHFHFYSYNALFAVILTVRTGGTVTVSAHSSI